MSFLDASDVGPMDAVDSHKAVKGVITGPPFVALLIVPR